MTIGLNETFYLLHLKIIAVVLHELSKNFHVNWNGMQSNDDSTVVLYVHLGVPFVPSDIINFNTSRWVSI